MRDFWIFRSLSLELLEAYGLPGRSSCLQRSQGSSWILDDDSIDCFATLDGIPVPDFRASLIYDSGNRYFCVCIFIKSMQ